MNLLCMYIISFLLCCSIQNDDTIMNDTTIVRLPEPERSGTISIEQTLQKRRSIRSYSDERITLQEISQLVWAAQGITDERSGFRTAPSAGATFPIEIYLIVTGIGDVVDGVYRYNTKEHALAKKNDGDLRQSLFEVSLRQPSIVNAPVVMVITGVLERTEQRYGQRALRYMYMEAGHVAQNVYLQGVALNIGTVVIGAFQDEGVSRIMALRDGEYPLYIMPLGKH
jgi:SagB-type dehydrogenase family enzyme